MAYSTELINRLQTILPAGLVYELLSAGQVFDVSAHGARGDGLTDDSASIQAAIDAAITADGGIVYLPRGTYKTTANLVIDRGTGVHIVGEGKGATIIAGSGTILDFTINATSTKALVMLAGCTRCSVRDLTVDLTDITETCNGIALPWFDDSSDVYSTFCDIINCEVIAGGLLYQYLIWLQAAEDCRVIDCDVDGGASFAGMTVDASLTANEGIELYGGHRNLVQGCNVKRTSGVAFNLFQSALTTAITASKTKILNCTVKDCWRGVSIASDLASGFSDYQIANITIDRVKETGVSITSATGCAVKRIHVDNVQVKTCDRGFNLEGVGTLAWEDVTISKCSVVDASNATTGACRVATANNVTFSECHVDGATASSFIFNTANNCKLLHSRVSNAGGNHVASVLCDNLHVIGTHFSIQTLASAMLFLDTSTTNGKILNNSFYNVGGGNSVAINAGNMVGGEIDGNILLSLTNLITPYWYVGQGIRFGNNGYGPLGAFDNGVKNGSAVTVVERGTGPIHQTVFTLTALSVTMTDAGAAGCHGSHKLYDFPLGNLTIIGATCNLTTAAGVGGIGDTAALVGAVGTAAISTDNATLTGTEADLIPSTAGTLSSGAGTLKGLSATAGIVQFDGTTTGGGGAKDAYLNLAVPDADSSASDTVAVTGTITISWINNGDR